MFVSNLINRINGTMRLLTMNLNLDLSELRLNDNIDHLGREIKSPSAECIGDFFERVQTVKKIPYKESWANGTGYFKAAAMHEDSDIPLGFSAFFCDQGRAALIHKTEEHLTVGFERYAGRTRPFCANSTISHFPNCMDHESMSDLVNGLVVQNWS